MCAGSGCGDARLTLTSIAGLAEGTLPRLAELLHLSGPSFTAPPGDV